MYSPALADLHLQQREVCGQQRRRIPNRTGPCDLPEHPRRAYQPSHFQVRSAILPAIFFMFFCLCPYLRCVGGEITSNISFLQAKYYFADNIYCYLTFSFPFPPFVPYSQWLFV